MLGQVEVVGGHPAPVPDTAPALDWASPDAAPGPSASTPNPTGGAGPVVVQPGDSLWELAEQDLAARGASTSDAAVAQAWPAWWAANREAVGDDPDLLQPGTPLTPPPADS